MSGLEIAAIIGAVATLLGVFGRGVAYLISLLVDQFTSTIAAKDEEIDELRMQLVDCQRQSHQQGGAP